MVSCREKWIGAALKLCAFQSVMMEAYWVLIVVAKAVGRTMMVKCTLSCNILIHSTWTLCPGYANSLPLCSKCARLLSCEMTSDAGAGNKQGSKSYTVPSSMHIPPCHAIQTAMLTGSALPKTQAYIPNHSHQDSVNTLSEQNRRMQVPQRVRHQYTGKHREHGAVYACVRACVCAVPAAGQGCRNQQ